MKGTILMKARLIRQKTKQLLLLPNGTVAIANEIVLKQLFLFFNDLSLITGKDGRWDDDCLRMEDVKGKTLAWVDDNNVLCVKENPFTPLIHNIVDEEYITLHEYAEMHGKNDNRIKLLCREGRIAGATKKAGKWFVPKHAPYPQDARYSGVEK